MPPKSRKSTGSSQSLRARKLLAPPNWLSSPTTKAGILSLRIIRDGGGCEARWSEHPLGNNVQLDWEDRVDETIDVFAAMTDVLVSADPEHYWFEDSDGVPFFPDAKIEDVLREEDGRIKVYILTQDQDQASSNKGQKSDNEKTSVVEGNKNKRKRQTGPEGREVHSLSLARQGEGKVMIIWADCRLVVPGTANFGDVVRGLAQVQSIEVATEEGSIMADGVQLNCSGSIATALGKDQIAKTVTVSLQAL